VTGKYSGLNWDASLTASMPLLPAIDTAGNVKEAAAKAWEAELNYQLSKNNALLEAGTAYDAFKASVSGSVIYSKALEAAEANYELQSKDYNYNLISNLDFLQAIESLQGARRDSEHAAYDTKRAYWRLMAASGKLKI
jgi:outer membrane protein TolC